MTPSQKPMKTADEGMQELYDAWESVIPGYMDLINQNPKN